MGNTALWQRITAASLEDELRCSERLLAEADSDETTLAAISAQAIRWITAVRDNHPQPQGIEALLLEYPLSEPEGVALMCLAEALLRIPDDATADALIRDLLDPIAWQRHLGHSDTLFVNAASWGLALTGRWLDATDHSDQHDLSWPRRLAEKLGEPVLRRALRQAMGYLAGQFVLGENLAVALKRGAADWRIGATHSFDMLGEAALTRADSERYRLAYRDAIAQIAAHRPPAGIDRASVSIKLSALHPRLQAQQWPRLQTELLPILCELIETAAANAVDITIDAEEMDRLELSLRIVEQLLQRLSAPARTRLGLAVQAYGKRALPVLRWLHGQAVEHGLTIRVRLVKGAYWDSEIKRAQQRGLVDYPVFTSKAATDLSYLACARWLLQHPEQFFPQFATHNALTIAAILQLQPDISRYEFQRLQGMGAALYDSVREQYPALRCRIYAPVGAYRDLLPYLVRRLLENGANASFMHQLHDRAIEPALLAVPPQQRLPATPPLPRPIDLWLPARPNTPGMYLHSEGERDAFFAELDRFRTRIYGSNDAEAVTVRSPHDGALIGYWRESSAADIDAALSRTREHLPQWQSVTVDSRAGMLERYAELLLQHRAELVALMARETGKTIDNDLEEIREAADFCRYYAQQARALLTAPLPLPHVTGEDNRLQLRARGVFLCISPWNFPLAIFTGQIVAALVAGNAVLAKPAEQATLTAQLAVQLLHQAGVPAAALQLLPGDGKRIGDRLCAADIDGVVFTGGGDTARSIQRQLAQRDGAIIPFVAETAGINALIADSSAQPQQLVNDVVRSAFDSAGQRCSALRVLYLPESCAAAIEELLCGAMRELRGGDPLDWSTDIGPIIDADAAAELRGYLRERQGDILFQGDAAVSGSGNFIAPTLLRVRAVDQLQREAFGPILHIARYDDSAIDDVVDAINALGFGLTCGIHSRNQRRAEALAQRLRIGNIYINRDIIGATVGAQPFGGHGRSGTGPKAGGPHYLLRFVTEQTITTNTAAIGGDHQLLSQQFRPNC